MIFSHWPATGVFFPTIKSSGPNTCNRRWLSILGTVFLGLGCSITPALGSGANCQTVEFFETRDKWFDNEVTPAAFSWASSAIRNGERLFVVDVQEMHIVGLAKNGKFDSIHTFLRSQDTRNRVDLIEPSLLYPRYNGGFLLLDDALADPGRLMAVSPDLTVEKQMQVEDKLLGDVEITAVFKFAELGDGVLAFADFQDPSEANDSPRKYWSGFVYLTFDGQYQFFGDRVPLQQKEYFIRDLSPIASVITPGAPNEPPKVAYVLMYDPNASWIAQVSMQSGTMTHLASLPADFAKAPKLERVREWLGDRTRTDQQLFLYYELFQNSRMPVGLVGDALGNLYVVVKGKVEGQRTPWWLVRLDPQTGTEISRSRIPTYAAHIIAPIIGAHDIAVIEKGEIALLGPEIHTMYRETTSMTVFSKSWLRDRYLTKTSDRVLFGCKVLVGGKERPLGSGWTLE